ncbi:MAG: hypothetical protein HRU33_17725 [Rhodobacteraceae bacterium]|nr:hypothetical protein [Paracoccaceae bacterium]
MSRTIGLLNYQVYYAEPVGFPSLERIVKAEFQPSAGHIANPVNAQLCIQQGLTIPRHRINAHSNPAAAVAGRGSRFDHFTGQVPEVMVSGENAAENVGTATCAEAPVAATTGATKANRIRRKKCKGFIVDDLEPELCKKVKIAPAIPTWQLCFLKN